MVGKQGQIIIVKPIRLGSPSVPSHRVRCDQCDDECWISDRAVLALGDGLLCMICAMGKVRAGDTWKVAPWVADDLADGAL